MLATKNAGGPALFPMGSRGRGARRRRLLATVTWLLASSGCPGPEPGPNDPGTAADAGSGAETTGLAVLPLSAFVFERRVKDGESYHSQIAAFDLATGMETLISDLGGKTSIQGLAVSPDRKSVAFCTTDVHLSDVSVRRNFTYDVVWVLSVDGSGRRRLSVPPLGNENMGGSAYCALEDDCPGVQKCVEHLCYYLDYAIEYHEPVWAPDGQSIIFNKGLWWADPYNLYEPVGGTFPVSVPLSGKAETGLARDCLLRTPIAFHPNGSTAVMGQDVCGDDKQAGFVEYGGQPLAPTRLLAKKPPLHSWVVSDSLAWSPDGTALLFTGQNIEKTRPDSPFYSRRQGLYLWAPAENKYKTLYEPPSDDLDIDDFALSGDGKHLIVAVRRPLGNNRVLLELAELDLASKQLTKLPIPGLPRRPRW